MKNSYCIAPFISVMEGANAGDTTYLTTGEAVFEMERPLGVSLSSPVPLSKILLKLTGDLERPIREFILDNREMLTLMA